MNEEYAGRVVIFRCEHIVWCENLLWHNANMYLDRRSTRLRSVSGCQRTATTVYPSNRDRTCVRLRAASPFLSLDFGQNISSGWRCDRVENKEALVEVAAVDSGCTCDLPLPVTGEQGTPSPPSPHVNTLHPHTLHSAVEKDSDARVWVGSLQ